MDHINRVGLAMETEWQQTNEYRNVFIITILSSLNDVDVGIVTE